MFVIDGKRRPLLGSSTAQELAILKLGLNYMKSRVTV